MKQSDKLKVYALLHSEPSYVSDKYRLTLKSTQTWQGENIIAFVDKAGTEIVQWNDVYYLSFSRKALLAKAREIKQEWIDKQKAVLNEIEAIKI